MENWKGKVVVVAGGSSGLGLAIAKAFVPLGASVVLLARDAQRLAQVVEKLNECDANPATGMVVDATNESAVADAVSEIQNLHGRIDAWINAIGQSVRTRFADAKVADYRRLMEQNFFGSLIAQPRSLACTRKGVWKSGKYWFPSVKNRLALYCALRDSQTCAGGILSSTSTGRSAQRPFPVCLPRPNSTRRSVAQVCGASGWAARGRKKTGCWGAASRHRSRLAGQKNNLGLREKKKRIGRPGQVSLSICASAGCTVAR